MNPLGPLTRPLALALAALLVPAAHAAEQRVLEEIVVTAQKREQNLQDVPVAVTAVTSEMLEALHIDDMADLTRASASLTLTGGDNKQNSGFRIRGIGTSVFSIGVEPSVAIIIDDVSQVQPGQALANLVDVERVEVLRGPQSTLFGKNASAGLISVVTPAPATEFTGFGELTATDDDEQRLAGVVTGPINERAGYRLSGYTRDYDGWAKNLPTGEDVNGSDEDGIRGKLAFSPIDDLDLTLAGWYAQAEGNCCSLTHRVLDPNGRLFGRVPVTTTNPLTLPRVSDTNKDPEIDVLPEEHTEDHGLSLHADWTIGEATVTSITGYNNWQYRNTGDVDWSAYDLAGDLTGGAQHGGIVSHSDTEARLLTQELRVDGDASEQLEYLAGLYFADAKTDRGFDRTFPLATDWEATAKTESAATFGQLSWHFTEATELTAGGRYNYEDITVDFSDISGAAEYSGNDSEGQWLGKLALQHFQWQDTMLFASVATGYKGQAYDISTGFTQAKADVPIGSESSISYELGVKTEQLERRLQLNAVAFFTKYDDYQAQNISVVNGEMTLAINNVGRLETSGVELDAAALIGDNLTLTSSVAWIDATVDKYPGANCYSGQTVAQGCVEIVPGSGRFAQDLSGEPLNNAPDWKLTLGAQYNLPLTQLPFDGYLNLGYTWQDKVNFDLLGNPATEQESYGLLNASVGILERASGRYRIEAFVNNVFDEDYTVAMSDDLTPLYGGATAIIQLLPRGAERYAGLRVRYSF